jgi:hypothetical protein
LAKKITDTDLQNEYGRDLTHVPFFLRNAYYLKYHVDWKSTYFTERKVFLRAYDTNLAAEQVKEKALAKAEAAKEKERLRLKKQEDRKIKDRLKAQADEEKAEEKSDRDRQREFNQELRSQADELKDMKRQLNNLH